MVYSSGNSDYRRVYPPTASVRSGPSDTESQQSRRLFIVVVVLGLATYGFSFGPVVDGAAGTGWFVRFAALAALCAAFGLLGKQKPIPLLTAVLASMGLLDALSAVVTTDGGWSLGVILALNALQAAAAVAALLVGPKAATDSPTAAGYEAYADYYNQAVRDYYRQQAQAAPQQQSQQGGYGQASADAQADAHAAPQTQRAQRTAQHGEYSDFVSPQSNQRQSDSAASSAAGPGHTVPQAGLPKFGPAQPRADRQEQEADQSEWPSSQ